LPEGSNLKEISSFVWGRPYGVNGLWGSWEKSTASAALTEIRPQTPPRGQKTGSKAVVREKEGTVD